MKFAKVLNKILSRFGLVMVRTATLERIHVGQQTAMPPGDLALAFKEAKEATDLNYRQLLRHQISIKWDIIDALERDRVPDAELSCPLCGYRGETGKFGHLNANCIFGGGELVRHQCPECDVIFGPEKMFRLSEAELSQDYEWHYQVFTEGDSTAQEVRAFHALNPEKPGVYLNWGAGAWSKSVEVLRQEGWTVYGFEPHGSASSGGPHVITSKAGLLEMRFDGIFSNNVLEHLRYPVRELSSMRELLKPGGKMSHATPCFAYLYEFTRFHLFFFMGRSRSILAQQANLHIEDFVADGEFMNLILSRD